MTTRQFNALPLRKKLEFIQSELKGTGERYGGTGQLVYKDKSIDFVVYDITGALIQATAEDLPVEFVARTEAVLKKYNRNFIYLNYQNTDPAKDFNAKLATHQVKNN